MSERVFKSLTFAAASLTVVLAASFLIVLWFSGFEAWKTFGLKFLFTDVWNPSSGEFGALGALSGTLFTSLLALLIATPLAFAAAMWASDAPKWIASPLSRAMDMLAAIPSVIFGMWGIDFICPHFGFSLFSASLILSIMILPYITAVMRDVITMTPDVLKESAYGLGATRFEVVKDVILSFGKNGLAGGIFIGLGRALGETMAVLFVAGGLNMIPSGLFDGCTTIASALANDFAEAEGLHRSVLFALGFILLMLEFAIQILAQLYLKRGKIK
ncbi:MAG: phosphate ABC transporter permease subunit PstC [Kiritimatiellae bacterium]|nr:phosphate ABC transporter permease subunit PstC [Kiritimatiellia bacterium]